MTPLLGCAAFTYTTKSINNLNPNLTPTTTQTLPVQGKSNSVNPQNQEDILINLYNQANPSVVNITVYQQSPQGIVPGGTGSGFVFDDKGRIVTNAHVVQDAEQLDVTFSDGQIQSAETIGVDRNSDLAVIQVEKVPDMVSPLPLGNMQELAVGQTVVAIGNPFGLDGTLTKGIISALGRTIPALTPFSIPQAIQTDAAINPGNSGGPLLDLHGHVIGINAQIETDGQSQSNSGVGFAIPVNIVNQVIPELISKGMYEWSWLGVRGGDVNPSLIKAMNLPNAAGAYLVEVTPGGPAEQAGIRGADKQQLVNGRAVEVGGDVVIAIDGKSIDTFNDLLVYIALETRPGQAVTLTIVRNSKESDIDLIVGSRPESVE
jgi:2-alkenal reductase